MARYLKKLFLILFIASSSIPFWYESVNATHEASEEREAEKRAGKRRLKHSDSEEESEKESEGHPKEEAEEPQEGDPALKKRRQKGKERDKGEASLISPESQAKKSADIGTWVGDKEAGLAALQLFYKGTLISEDILPWHREMGQQIKEIVALRGADKDKTNYIRTRLDFVYKQEDSYKIIGQEIPALFISGHSNIKAKKAVLRLQEDIAHITKEPCISINSYFEWSDLGDEGYAPIREVLRPLFKAVGVDDRGHQADLIAPTLLEKEEESLENPKEGAFQGWLHSEEPLIFYFLGREAKTATDETILSFKEILSQIQLPKDVIPELCVISMVSRNDCCTHCRPLVLEATQHKEFLEKGILEGLNLGSNIILKKVLLYSALKDFHIKRPEEGYISKVDLGEEKDSILFLMAGNNPATIGHSNKNV